MKAFLCHLFLPHHTNNHRAKALHLDALMVYILLLALFNLGIRIAHNQFPQVLGYATDIRVDQLLSLTNEKRAEKGLSVLNFNEKLSQAAYMKAEDMFANGYWSHTSPEGKTPWQFIVSSGYTYTMAGENLAKNFSTSKGVVDAWMASPTHRDNIVKSGYHDVGFAIVNGVLNGEETTLVVQIFGNTKQSQVAIKPVEAVEQLALGEATQRSMEGVIGKNSVFSDMPKTMFEKITSVVYKPLINIPTLTRDIVFVFVGFLIGLFLVDGFLVSKHKIVRVRGHNIAHIIFLVAIGIALLAVERGALL